VVETGIEAVSETPQGIGFTHARSRSENTYASDVFEVIEAVCHLVEILGDKAVFFFKLLLVKRIKGQTIKTVIH
jgi:hypothetical protein